MPSPGVQLDATPCTSLSRYRESLPRLVHCPSFDDQYLSPFIFHPGAPSRAGSASPLTWENWCLATLRKLSPKKTDSYPISPSLSNLILTIKVISFHCRKPGKHMKGTALLKVYFQKPSADFNFIHSFIQSFSQQILKLTVLSQSKRERERI